MATLILQPDEDHLTCRDTFIGSAAFANMNFGGFDLMYLGTQSLSKGVQAFYRPLLRFDLTALTGTSISDATLTLTLVNGSLTGDTFTVHRLTQPNWTELGATWNLRNGAEPWAAVGGDFVAAPAQSLTIASPQNLVFADLQSIVEDAVRSRGGILDLLIKGTALFGLQFLELASASHQTPASRPKLVVNYTNPVWCVTSNDAPVWSVDIQDEGC